MVVMISNTGQRVWAILVAVVAVIAAAVAITWYVGRQNEIASHKKAKEGFQKAHNMGYVDFWTKTRVDIKELKSNEEFELKMKQLISGDPVKYGKYIKEQCLPLIDRALPEYKAVEVPGAYADKMNAVTKAAEKIRESWNSFADELLKFEGLFKGKEKLDKTADAWFGAQQSDNDKYKIDAFKYFKLLECVLPDQKIEEISVLDINGAIRDSCIGSDKRAAWFRRVGYECIPGLLEDAGEPNDSFAATIAASRKEDRMDSSSKFAVEDCLDSSRDWLESELIEPLALSWAGYVKAQNDLLDAIKAKVEKLK
jgi:hypothetical protein